MKVISCTLENFSSYEKLELPDIQGLTLIHGPTGSGKSTLCDAIPWVLFGKTAKNGTADEVLSWNTKNPTIGHITVETYATTIQVHRIRSVGKNNDLWVQLNDDPIIRGANLADTQKFINSILGMDCDQYLAAAYFHEFSRTASFFTADAKIRRLICEQIVDLELPKTLQTKCSDQLKAVKLKLSETKALISSNTVSIQLLTKELSKAKTKSAEWTTSHSAKLEELKRQYEDFDKDKKMRLVYFNRQKADKDKATKEEIAKLANLVKPDNFFKEEIGTLRLLIDIMKQGVCDSCGSPKNSDKIQELNNDINELKRQQSNSKSAELKIQELTGYISPYDEMISTETKRKNTYAIQYTSLQKETNPHDYKSIQQDTKDFKQKLSDLEIEEQRLSELKSDLDLLQDVISVFRSKLVEGSIIDIQNKTNEYLRDFFDAEFSVLLEIQGSDKLEVQIFKDGNSCVYTQLSKGQRQLLKLCFGISTMQYIKRHNNLNISSIFLDEAFDGLDDVIKHKVFRFIENVSVGYDQVFVVEHSTEIKACFTNKISVTISDNISEWE